MSSTKNLLMVRTKLFRSFILIRNELLMSSDSLSIVSIFFAVFV